MSRPTEPEPLPDHLRRLRSERKLSRSLLSRATVAFDGKGLAEATVKALEGGRNDAGPATIEALAHGLQVPPETFPEYRLALARRQLDPGHVGLAQALAALARFEKP